MPARRVPTALPRTAHRPPKGSVVASRRVRKPPFLLGLILLTVLSGFDALRAATPASEVGAPAATPATPSFAREVLPVLSDHCFACHGPDEKARKAGLRLDTAEGARTPARSGRIAVVPKRPEASELIRRITSDDPEERMPPPESNRRPSPAETEILRRWIEAGASWGLHWAYEPPETPPLPRLAGPTPPHPIDALVRARLEREGLAPAPEAPKAALIRRLSLDLTGLPPTPDEIETFRTDTLPGAWERLVDRLLGSPHFGERMAWDWLEAARYADSNGYQGDAERTMWPWRDWVIDAFNRNLPFDQFTLWQLAGDLLPDASFEQRLATGFLRNHAINGEGGRIPEENRIDYLFDQTETVGTVWLGATFNCTRCHNHKFDPITQRDYFSLLAFFNRTAVDGSGGDPQSRPNLEVPTPEQRHEGERLNRAFAATADAVDQRERTLFPCAAGRPVSESADAATLPAAIREILALPPARRDASRLAKLIAEMQPRDPAYATLLEELRRGADARERLRRGIPRVMVMEDLPNPRDTFILSRGLYTQPGVQVFPAVPEALGPRPEAGPGVSTNRLALARWLIQPGHPLTARVTVNRFWQALFGTGLVKTAEDFGVQGERPFHPDLLDWLATEFVRSGWDVKHLLRRIVTSATYRQSSVVTPENAARDPENRLLARGPRHRLPSWMIRDTALAAAGLLEPGVGGPPVRPYQPPGVWEEATFGNKRYQQDHGESLYRRSLYVFWRRIVAPTLFFDTANRATCTVRTPRTNVPLHALLTLNDPTYIEAARALAVRILRQVPDTSARLDLAGVRVLGRPLDAFEHRRLESSLARHHTLFDGDRSAAARLLGVGESPAPADLDPGELAAWTLTCHTLFNLDEAISKE